MKFIVKNLVVLMVGFMIHNQLVAQEYLINGVVTTFDSIPLVGAQIQSKVTKQVVQSDSLGGFEITCNNNDKLKVSAHGFIKRNVKVSNELNFVPVNLTIKPGKRGREYAIGYGHVLDADKLNAVASLSEHDMDFSQYRNIYDIIDGRFSGVQIVNGEVIIRGINSLMGSSAALIVVDGIASDYSVLETMAPIEVKNISVLKDGGAAIYGSRGANGVVIIETKKGNDVK